MVLSHEAGGRSCGRERAVDLGFERCGHRHVAHGAAAGADQVVVVLGQVLGQFVPGPLAGGDEALDQAALLQHGEVPIHRTLGEVAPPLEDVGDRERSTCAGEEVQQVSAVRREALALRRESGGGEAVQPVEIVHRPQVRARVAQPAGRAVVSMPYRATALPKQIRSSSSGVHDAIVLSSTAMEWGQIESWCG
jgi:hypothetical protein